MAMEEEEEECRVVSRVQSGSGRLGAAVQRVMAMRERERQSSDNMNMNGIGEMRRICLANNSTDPFCFSDRFEQRPLPDEELGNYEDLSAKRTQSMRYTSISSLNSDHGDDNEEREEYYGSTSQRRGINNNMKDVAGKGWQSKKNGLVGLICKQFAFIKRHAIWS